MLCPKCSKGEVKEHISISGFWLWQKKIVIHFCTLCDFRNEQSFDLSVADKLQEENYRKSKIEMERIEKLNTKINKKNTIYNEDKKYSREDIE